MLNLERRIDINVGSPRRGPITSRWARDSNNRKVAPGCGAAAPTPQHTGGGTLGGSPQLRGLGGGSPPGGSGRFAGRKPPEL